MATIKSKLTAKTTSVNTGTAAKPKLPTTGGLSTVKKTATKATGATQGQLGSFSNQAKKKTATDKQPAVKKPAEYQAPQFDGTYTPGTFDNSQYQMPTFDKTYEATPYESKYQAQIDQGMNNILNREKFNYDPMKDANYQALAGLYSQQGNKAAKDTMADAATLNGGYGSSFAQTAAQQVRNDYNQQLAAMIPELEQNAYNKYLQSYNMDRDALNMLQAADESAYGRHRDAEADNKWKYEQDYNKYRDDVADKQYHQSFDYNQFRDTEADKKWQYEQESGQHRDNVADSQWNYGMDYQKYRDDIGDQQWQKEYDRGVLESDRAYNYQVDRDKVADNQWQQSFDRDVFESNRDYNRGVFESNRDYNYGVKRDNIAAQQWNKEFNHMVSTDKDTSALAWAEYNLAKKDSGTSGSGNSSAPTYTATGNTGLDASSIWKRASNK